MKACSLPLSHGPSGFAPQCIFPDYSLVELFKILSIINRSSLQDSGMSLWRQISTSTEIMNGTHSNKVLDEQVSQPKDNARIKNYWGSKWEIK